MRSEKTPLQVEPSGANETGLFKLKSWLRFAVTAGVLVVASTLVGLFMLFAERTVNGPFASFEQLSIAMVSILATTAILISGNYLVFKPRKSRCEAHKFGHYRLHKMVGSGGMGEVWIAEHEMLPRPAAVKLIRRDLIGSEGMSTDCMLKRFKREVQATALLQSPHTVEVHDYGITEDGTFYYVMEFLDGLDLETLVKQFGPVSAERAVHVLSQACKSLAEAHQIGLIHRDLKPSNIFVCRLGLDYDFVKVLDFGLVKQLRADDPRLTVAGVVTGTPAFLAPELALDGGQADARSDIYALGCVAYWLVTGHLVFESQTPIGTILQHTQAAPIPPSRCSELEIPETLERIILSCLEKSPDNRPQSALNLLESLAYCSLPRKWDQKRAKDWWEVHVRRRSVCEASLPGVS